MAQRESLRTSWVYTLNREELMSYLEQCSHDSSWTVEEMRKRMVKLINTENDENLVQKLFEWQKQHDEKDELLRVPTDRSTSTRRTVDAIGACGKERRSTPNREDRIATIDLVRKWGLKYDGGKEIFKFVDRLEELASIYEIDLSEIVPVMCELFTDRALVWLRNNHKPWSCWAQFKNDFLGFFLPPRYMENLEAEIRSRTQRPRENFKDYVLALQDLMYHSSMSKKEKLEIIFRNSAPDYQWYIKRRDFETLDDLLLLATELECIPTSRHSGRNEHHRMLKEQSGEYYMPNKSMTQLTWAEEKIRATIFLNQQSYAAMIDTGATRSFVSPACIKRMKLRPTQVSTNVTVTLADGSIRQISTAVNIRVTLGNLTRPHQFLVMEMNEAVVLGLDFLKTFNTTIQCAGLKAKHQKTSSVENRKYKSHHEVRGPTNIHFSHSSRQSVDADALSRNPTGEVNLVQVKLPATCPWYERKMDDVRKCPEKHVDYTVMNQQVYRHVARKNCNVDTTSRKLCVPTHQRRRVMAETHEQSAGGHMSIRKTLNKLANRYYWRGMARDVSKYVRRCKTCQQNKTEQQQPDGKRRRRLKEEPWLELKSHSYSPIPPPPSENTASPPLKTPHCPNPGKISLTLSTTTDSSQTVIGEPVLAPMEIQKFILERKEENKGKRYRTVQAIGESVYRITIKPNNTVQITLVKQD